MASATSGTIIHERPKLGNSDFEISVLADELLPGEMELVGRVRINVYKKTGIYGLAVTLAPTNFAKILTHIGYYDERRKMPFPTPKRFWLIRDTFKYLPFQNCSVILQGNKVPDIIEWARVPTKSREHPVYSLLPGIHEFPFSFDLSSLEGTVGNFEHKCKRGFATIENNILVTVALFSGSPGLVTFPHRINLPNYAKLEQGLKKVAETTCCLKKGNQELVKFALKLNQQGYAFGEEVEFRVEKTQQASAARLVVIREMAVSMVRKIMVLVPKMEALFLGFYQETKSKHKVLLDKTILASKSTHLKGPCWSDSFVLPEGIIDTTDMSVEVSHGMEVSTYT
ncbi:unnamed protein product [Allacma fusca]|uniref:Uncharacterized protein n=1 Tax=Allacma fusca TaxID=39272 RepID=A0A8J2JIJ3_9HEXA|nr:unnamed protein product [Allacma fusca]